MLLLDYNADVAKLGDGWTFICSSNSLIIRTASLLSLILLFFFLLDTVPPQKYLSEAGFRAKFALFTLLFLYIIRLKNA